MNPGAREEGCTQKCLHSHREPGESCRHHQPNLRFVTGGMPSPDLAAI